MLKEWLKKHGKTQEWLAEKMGVTPPAITYWFQSGIPANRVLEIHKLTRLPVKKLLEEAH